MIFSMLQSESKPAIIALPFFKPHNNCYNMFLKIFQHFFKAIQNPTNFICPRYFSPLSLLAFVYENNTVITWMLWLQQTQYQSAIYKNQLMSIGEFNWSFVLIELTRVSYWCPGKTRLRENINYYILTPVSSLTSLIAPENISSDWNK